MKRFNFDQDRSTVLLWLTPIAAALAIILGASVLLGWVENFLWIARLSDTFIPMSPTTALCFILFGVVLLCRQRQPKDKVARRVWQTLAIFLLVLNSAVFIQSAFFNLSDLLLSFMRRVTPDIWVGQNYTVGIMSPLTASLFVILSFAALLSPPARAVVRLRDHLAQSAAVLVLVVAGIIVIGYWYGAPLLYGGATVPVALTTAIGFIFLSGGFLFEEATAWLFRWMTSDSVSSRFTRVTLPGIIGIILINGWMQLTVFSQLPTEVQVLYSSLVAIFTATLISLVTVMVARQAQAAITRAEYALRGSEKRFKALIENSADVIVIVDATGIIRFASPVAERVLGYKPEEAIGKNYLEWVHPDDLSEAAQSLARRSQTPGKADSSSIVRGRHKNGSWRFMEAIGTNLLDEPTVQGIVLNMRDVTVRKQAEDALRLSEVRYRALFQQSHDAIFIMDLNGKHLVVNQRAADMLGYTLDEMQHLSVNETSAELEASKDIIRRVAAGEQISLYERLFRKKDGTVFPVEIDIELVRDGNGNPMHLQGVVRDVTERKRTEEAMRESEESYRGLFNSVTEAIYIQDEQGRFLDVNQGAVNIYGYPRDYFIGRTPLDLAAPDRNDMAAAAEKVRRAFAGESQQFEFWGRRSNGEIFPKEVVLNRGVYFGQPVVFAAARDITERKRAEEVLRWAEERYRTLFEEAPLMYITTRIQADIPIVTECNQAFLHTLGYTLSEVMGQPLSNFYTPESRKALLEEGGYRRALERNFTTEERDLLTRDGHVIHTMLTPVPETDTQGNVIGTRAMYVDITERKRAEEALRLSEAMLKASQRVAQVGHYVFDIMQGGWSSSEALDDIFGINGSYPRTLEGWSALIAPDYRAQMVTYFSDHVLRDHRPFDKEYPLQRVSDGALRWVHGTGELEFDGSGQPLKMFGTIQDITPHKETERKLQRRAEQLAILNDISNRVTLSTSVNEVLQRVAQLVQEHFHYHYVGLFLYDTEHAELVLRAQSGNFTNLFPLDHHLRADQGMVGWVCRERRTLLANDVRLEPAYVNVLGNRLAMRSELSVPIQSGEALFGVIDLQSAELNAFEDSDVLLIETLAQQIVAALENARLHEWAFKELAERERHEREMDTVIRMGATLRNVGSRAELSAAVVQLLREALGVEHALFGAADLLTGERVVIGASGNWTPLQGQRFATSFARQIAPDGTPHLVKDADRSKFAHPELLEGLAGVVVTQLLINEEQLGSLWIGSARPISEETLHLFALLSGLVANVVQRVNSVEQTERHTRRLTALHEIDLAISYSLDLEQTLNVLLNQVCNQLRVDAADVLLYNRETQVLSYAAGFGFHTAALQHSLLRIGESLAGRAALEKKIVSSVDLSQTNNFSISPLFRQENFLSYYGVPLATRGEVVGVLEIFHRSPLQPTPDWLQFLEALAAQAAIAIDNASLFTQLQSSIKSLYETQEQLIRTARLSAVGELAAGIAHQINNPLTTVISDSQVLMRLTPDDDPLHVSAKAIYQAGWRAQRVVQRLLNFARPDDNQYAPSNVNETIMESLDLIGAHLGRGGVDLQLHLASDLPLISANAHQLEEIWLNLLMNARDALSEERKGRIEVTSCVTADGNELEVSISDNGRGIRESDRANIFTPFFTTKGNNRGNGLGLSVCQSIAQHHGGEITFSSAEDVGTTFVVRMPLSRASS